MMQKNRRISRLCIALIFPCLLGAAPMGDIDSLVPAERIESAIAFLEDSQKVAELVRQLHLLNDARRAVRKELGTDSLPKERRSISSVNIFNSLRRFHERWRTDLAGVRNELGGLFDELRENRPGSAEAGSKGGVISLLIIVAVSMAAGMLISAGLWRFGKRLRSETGKDLPVRGASGYVSIALTCTSSSLSAIFIFLLLALIPFGASFHAFTLSVIAGVSAYAVGTLALELLFSPEVPQLRNIPCSDSVARRITRSSRELLRTILVMYIAYRSALALGLNTTGNLISVAFQLILVFFIPYTLFRMRPFYLDPYRKYRSGKKKDGPVHVFTEFLLARLYAAVAIYLFILSVMICARQKESYAFFLSGTLKSVFMLLVMVLLALVWRVAMRRIAAIPRVLPLGDRELQVRFLRNAGIIRSAGYALIGVSAVFFLVKIWGNRGLRGWFDDIPFLQIVFRIGMIVAGIWVLTQAVYYVIGRFGTSASSRMLSVKGANAVEVEKRVSTLRGITQKIITASLLVLGAVMILDELGFDVKAMVAGIGIVGLAVGFGAQNLVRDVISGLFVIFENRIRVGDVAVVNGTGGVVEQVNLRTTVLRSLDGTIHVFPNGAITSLSNMTHEYSFYVFEIRVAYKEDTDRVGEVLRKIGEELEHDPEYRYSILDPMELMGVDSFSDSAVILKGRIKTLPIKQWYVGREFNRRVKKKFDELGIEIPFPQRTIHFDGTVNSITLENRNTDKG